MSSVRLSRILEISGGRSSGTLGRVAPLATASKKVPTALRGAGASRNWARSSASWGGRASPLVRAWKVAWARARAALYP